MLQISIFCDILVKITDLGGIAMVCPSCGSSNVNVQAVGHVQTKKKGFLYWIIIGWWLEPLLWLFFTIPMIFAKLFGGKGKVKTKVISHAVCQNCGKQWEVK